MENNNDDNRALPEKRRASCSGLNKRSGTKARVHGSEDIIQNDVCEDSSAARPLSRGDEVGPTNLGNRWNSRRRHQCGSGSAFLDSYAAQFCLC
jgi:hypothetical protein